VGSHPVILSLGTDLGHWPDRALDELAAREVFEPAVREWSIVLLAEPFPEARVAPRARTAASMGDLMGRLTREDDLDTAWFLSEDHLARRPDGRSASLRSWDGTRAVVEHDGPCDLVVARSFDPGWTARINGGPLERVIRVDGGCQGVRLAGSGKDMVELRYSPPGWQRWLLISSIAAGAAILVLALSVTRRTKKNRRGPPTDHGLSLSSSFRMVSINGPMICSLKSKRMPAAANSSGRGREPPSARAFL
jgi:hypothetical protein